MASKRLNLIYIAILLLAFCPPAYAKTYLAKSIKQINQYIQNAKPGDTIKIAPGTYPSSHYFKDISGTKKNPISITAQDSKNPPTFDGQFKRTQAIQFSACHYLHLSHINITRYVGNGLNVDDGNPKRPRTLGVELSHINVSHIGPKGNHDGIKLSGLDQFSVKHCNITAWASSGIDLVGCSNGIIDHVTIKGHKDYTPANGIQIKGGSHNIQVTNSFLLNTGHRGINLGGSTGKPYFRPLGANYEAKNITIAGNRIVGANAAIAFASAIDSTAHHNTIVNPQNWILRILQDNASPNIKTCANSTFHHNLIVYNAKVRTTVNIGPKTAPHTFKFHNNAWYQQRSFNIPALPTIEKDGLYLKNPKLKDPLTAESTITSTDKRFIGIGAQYYKPAE